MSGRTKIESKSKSARVRDRLSAGENIADAARAVGIGYAFAYGIAARMTDPESGRPMSEIRANRRAVRSVSVVGGAAIIHPVSGGTVRVDLETGAVTRSKK